MKPIPFALSACCALLLACQTPHTQPSANATHHVSPDIWQPDLTNGTYKNPVIHADYSDPDAIRVGDMYYMTSSSFNSAPGLPLLQSKDMINWELVGHALPQQIPEDVFAVPQHGKGVWAPCIRYHDNQFWIFYPDPDFGIYVITAKNFTGPWSKPHLLLAGKGIIDPTPLWDDDGNAYLLHAWAKSRAGINNMLTLRKMSADAKTILDTDGKVVIDGNKLPNYRTLEGPKFYKYNGYYYVFAPAGGVEFGWQSVFRAKNIAGPYEDKIVMDQGSSPINGPHQGAWVRNADGSDWFYHFQDKGAYGRIVHLQPMHWKNDWPVIGGESASPEKGQPVLVHKKPIAGNFEIKNPATSDDFSAKTLGYQWQWNANWKTEWYSLQANKGNLRLFTQADTSYSSNQNLWMTPSILTQKLPAENFSVTVKMDIDHLSGRAGLLMYGFDYAWVGVERQGASTKFIVAQCEKAESNCKESISELGKVTGKSIRLKMTVHTGAQVSFAFANDQGEFTPVSKTFTASVGRWVGAQLGVFTVGSTASAENFVDMDYFNFEH